MRVHTHVGVYTYIYKQTKNNVYNYIQKYQDKRILSRRDRYTQKIHIHT